MVGVTLDPEDKENSNEPVAKFSMQPTKITMVGLNVKIKYAGQPLRNSIDPTRNYKKLFEIKKNVGKLKKEIFTILLIFGKKVM